VPAGKVVLGAKIISAGDTLADFAVFKGAGPGEVFPHYAYGPAESGWVLQAKQANVGVQIEVYYADPPTVTVQVAPSSVANIVQVAQPIVAEDGPQKLTYTFTATGPLTRNITVAYEIGGSATAGSDFTGIPMGASTGAITIPANSSAPGSAAALTITPTPDTVVEPDETVVITLKNGTGYGLGTDRIATGTIKNDDFEVDLDVDSDNTGNLDRTPGEDDIEEATDGQGMIVRPGVIVPVGPERTKMIAEVPAGMTATLGFAQGIDMVRVYAQETGGEPVLKKRTETTTVVGGSPRTFWIEAFAPSANMADIAFTLTLDVGASSGSTGAPPSDMIRATAVAADLMAHRTGGRLGEVVSDDLESAGDPNSYMILTNRDFEQGIPLAGRDFDDEIALLPPLLGPEGQADDDVAKITLKQLPSGLNAGSVRLKVSHPAAVRLFKADAATGLGVPLLAGEWSASLGGSGYLAQLKSRDVDIWLEGLSMVKDFVFTVEYVAPSGRVLSSDDVHMLIADWTFRGSDGYEVPFVSPVWLDALLAATDSPKKPLADPTGAFYKIHIDGLAPQLVTQLLVASDSTADFYTESYAGGDFDTAYSNATVSRRFGVLHSAAHVLYAPEDPVVTPAQRALIRDTLDLNVVHNDGLRATAVTPWDTQEAAIQKYGRFEWSLTDKPEGIYEVGDTIRGTVTWPEKMFPVLLGQPVAIGLDIRTDESMPQKVTLIAQPDVRKMNFEFTAREAGPLRLTFGPTRQGGIVLSSILVRITADHDLPTWEKKAWNALKVDGFVPGDPINRNRQITTRYAEIFNTDKKPNELNPFEWFGMAAFASRLAGDGMHTAMGLDWVPDAPDRVGGVDSRKLFQGLAEGNLEIFIDMYKAGLAYSENKFETIKNSAEFSPEQKNAWEIIERGQTAGKIEVIWEGVDGLVDVEQSVALQRVLNKDPDLWRRATNNVGRHLSKVFMISSPFPGDTSTFQDYRVNPDGNNPRIPADATFDQVEHRLTWIRSRIPKWRGGWRARYDSIDIPKLLNGDYDRQP
jgi:hypothetical protein